MTSIALIALNTEELIEDAMCVGRMSLNLAQATRERDALVVEHVEAIYRRAEAEWENRVFGSEWDQWQAEHEYEWD